MIELVNKVVQGTVVKAFERAQAAPAAERHEIEAINVATASALFLEELMANPDEGPSFHSEGDDIIVTVRISRGKLRAAL